MSEEVAARLLARREDVLARLEALLRAPSISTDPAYAGAMKTAREMLLARLREIGMQDVRLLDGGFQPAVYGAWNGAPGKPTIMIYGHYDVQPPDPLELWKTPPFEPTVRDGRLYARGASDMKGAAVVAVETVAAFLENGGKAPVNIRFFLEGEEEVGSPSAPKIIAAHRDLLKADAMISADGGRASLTTPTLSVACRGLTALEFTLRTASKDAHSGSTGGALRNALVEMAKLIATLHDDQGRIQVAGYFDGAMAVTDDVRADAAALPFDEAEWYRRVDAAPYGDPAYTVRERTTVRPTVEVNGMWGGYTGTGLKTVLPCEAHAKLTMRLVPGQDPAHAQASVRKHLEARAPKGVTLAFRTAGPGTAAYSLAADSKLLGAAERVIERVRGARPVRVRMGGTVPVMTLFHDMLGFDTLTFGLSMPDEDAHAPNEFLRLSSIDEGLRSWPMLLEELGKLSPEEVRGKPA